MPLSGLSPVRGQEPSLTTKASSHEQRVKTNPFDKSKVPLQEKSDFDDSKVPSKVKNLLDESKVKSQEKTPFDNRKIPLQEKN